MLNDSRLIDKWRAGYIERCTSGSGGGSAETAGVNPVWRGGAYLIVYFRHLIHEDDLKGRSNELNHAMHASLNKVYSNVRQIVRHQRTGELDADAVTKIRFLEDKLCEEIYLLANQK